MQLEHFDQLAPFQSLLDKIQWRFLFLSKRRWNFSQREREQCLEEVREWARRRADRLALQIIRDYWECCNASGPPPSPWFWSNRDNPEFCWKRRFSSSETNRTANSVRVKWDRDHPRIRPGQQTTQSRAITPSQQSPVNTSRRLIRPHP